ncbi:MAG: type I DNA topoisomerase [Candidatus Woesebacteria bacterium]|nr:type I DNA topoisomerase [Candidatus Woesebacteria bacterium]
MKFIIVESPTKANTLSKFLGSGYDVDSTKGHIMDLPKSKLSIDIENNFKPDYLPLEKKKDVIKELQKKAKKANEIYIATDPDREGEAIAAHVEQILRYKDIKSKQIQRISFHEITKKAIEDAISHPSVINQNLVDAQIARRVLDRLVGYKLSPLLWKKVRRGLSAGRVQSVAVRLIVDKENEIKAFKSQEYWEIYAKFTNFTAQLIKQEVKNKTTADKILADLEVAKYKVADVKKREVRKNPYPPFTTSTMTQAAARMFGWSAKRTMSAAQSLYEQGLITYHRTDSLNLSVDAVNIARKYIEKEYGKEYITSTPRAYKTNSKSAQEAHEAIRPTDVSIHGEDKLYDLIRKRFLACQMAQAIYSETTIDVSADEYLLRASGQIMKFDGWTRLRQGYDGQGKLELPNVEKDEELEKQKVWADQKFTLAPARYNEASLIKTLEKLGIGRPSTYAPIISTIQLRSYVEKKEKNFFPTTIGFAVTEFLVKNFANELEYSFTAEMEEDLDRIAEGKIKWQEEMKKFWTPFSKKLESVEKTSERVKIETEKLGKKCPDCVEGELVIRVGRFGKFVSCSTFPECKHTEKFLDKVGIKCPDCKQSLAGDAGKNGDVIVKKSGKGRNFFGCSNYPKCKFVSWKLPKKEESNVT